MASTVLLLLVAIVAAWFVACVPVIVAQRNPEIMDVEHLNINNRFGVLNLLSLVPQYKECFLAPNICPNKNVSFYLYTSKNPNSAYLLDTSQPETIRNAPLLPGKPIKFLFHGYTGDRDYSPNTEIRPEYLKFDNLNVISIDYGPLVKAPCYVWAVYNVAVAANCTAQLIDMMVASKKVLLNQFHIVGFSLGAQVSGLIANYIKSGKVERITGLDPAMPLFYGNPNSMLDAFDAKFVDVIHTNAGRRGKLSRLGHVDFYVNGGTNQPGCENSPDGLSSCSHVRAPILFAESIHTTVGFWGFRCGSLPQFVLGLCTRWDGTSRQEIMGEYVRKKATGIYVVLTNDKSPYARGYKNTSSKTSETFQTRANVKTRMEEKSESEPRGEETGKTTEEGSESFEEDSGSMETAEITEKESQPFDEDSEKNNGQFNGKTRSKTIKQGRKARRELSESSEEQEPCEDETNPEIIEFENCF